jgi:hypothetical protein
MAFDIGSVDDTGQLAHYNMLETIKDFCDGQGWTIHRYDDSVDNHELIMSAPGYSVDYGAGPVAVPAYVGIRTYQSVASDYYNLLFAGFTGYVSDNTFDTQPGVKLSGVPAHNQHIDYWLTVNDRRLAIAMKVGTPVYESGYLGYCLPVFATPRQFPYPLVCAGMLSGAAATRFSDTSHSIPYKGARANMSLRFVSGSWINPSCHPWSNSKIMAGGSSNYSMRPANATDDEYALMRVKMFSSSGVMGELEGIYAVTGFNNAVETTVTIAGDDYVFIQDVGRNGFIDYYALRLD